MTLYLGAADRTARAYPEHPVASAGILMPVGGFSVLRGLYRSLAQPVQREPRNAQSRSDSSHLKGNR
jgi:hypothetical protein